MRCPKCQYVGFEPSPRCKNCGYELSLGNESHDEPIASAPSLTLVTEPEFEGPMADFDLQIFDDVPAKRVQSGAKPFDLDELLANGPSSGNGERDAEPVIAAVSAVARRRQSASRSASASAVATPPPMEIEALFKSEPPAPAPAPAFAPAPAAPMIEPVTLSIEPEPEAQPEPAWQPEPETPAVVVSTPPVAAIPAPAAPVTTELPLFMQGMSPVVQAPVPATIEAAADAIISDSGADMSHADIEIDDRPLVKVPVSPRAPLAVRRTTPDQARMRAKYGKAARAKDAGEMSGDLLLEASQPDMRSETRRDPLPPAQRLSAEPTPTSLPADWLPGVGPAKRIMAAALDGALLLGLNASVIWFTLSVCGLAPAQANLLPVAPLLLFFLLLDAGYLVLFTAACGQTLGKMAAGIRVVGTTTGAVINDRITIAQAVMRSLASIVSMLPLGAGFWFGLVGDRRAAHDRIAHTRVVLQ
jgi:uncharacterized RDD family membrane protein YckC